MDDKTVSRYKLSGPKFFSLSIKYAVANYHLHSELMADVY